MRHQSMENPMQHSLTLTKATRLNASAGVTAPYEQPDPDLDDSQAARIVTAAIDRLAREWQDQPDLDSLAEEAGLSPGHFQRLFKSRAGISPKRFAQFVTLGHARKLLRDNQGDLLNTALDLGLSGPSRLHDLFVVAEACTPGQYKSGGAGVDIRYGFHESLLGRLLIAATARGVCFLGFVPEGQDERGLAELLADWPDAVLSRDDTVAENLARKMFHDVPGTDGPLTVHVRGTNFQLKIWQALLQIPFGQVRSYYDIAKSIGHPGAARAAGNAIGANRISFLIPCHRVIRSTGVLDDYRWGPQHKRALLAWEACKVAAE
jgi:AraC family transcriptional regulator, regulatory protein of adaptative response / methylated-DNA-[protein]-cysteine methyltransferase